MSLQSDAIGIVAVLSGATNVETYVMNLIFCNRVESQFIAHRDRFNATMQVGKNS
jgi:hypothetical protein